MKKNHHPKSVLSWSILLSATVLLSHSVLAVDFVFNGFNSSDLSLYGHAALESRILRLTNRTTFTIGRALYHSKVPTRDQNSSHVYPFSTSFIFSMAPYRNSLSGHGIVFLFVPFSGIEGASSAQHLGLFNFTNNGNSSNHVFGVEFDVFANQEFNDINNNHVGVDVNSLTSLAAETAGYWPDGGADKVFDELTLNNGMNYQVWIDYSDSVVNVTMAPAGKRKPNRPLLNVSVDLSMVFEDEMYVGFTAATGALVESHRILAWSFSNSNFSLSDELITTGLPSFQLPKSSMLKSKGFIAGITVGGLFVIALCVFLALVFVRRKKRIARERADMEEWELEYWPHRITYQEIEAATGGFSEKNVIGIGGNGKVYKGVLGGAEVAVKRISQESNEGMREFLAEVSSLGRLKHRSLVGFRGWCKKEKGSFMLVYDYMENGSLDKRLFECEDESKMLSLEDRLRILKDVASAVLYLHEGWEARVLHRDIKASNVLLDKEMNGGLGDFGLARMHSHGQVASTTRVVGTVGYLAPEVIRTGKASAETDVFGFGILILEVMCGRRSIEEGNPPLVDWVWQLKIQNHHLVEAIDQDLRVRGGLDEEEAEKVIQLGLLCAYPDSNARPTMRQVVKFLEGRNGGDDTESEDMERHLLQKLKSKDMLYDSSVSFGYSSHPTFSDIRQSLSSTTVSLNWSTTSVEGR